jgi:hypothetical protein
VRGEIAMERGMKVKELIALLEHEDPEAEVHYAYDYGDHVHTTVTEPVADVDEGVVKWSEYHNRFSLVDDEDGFEEKEDGDRVKTVVVLSC